MSDPRFQPRLMAVPTDRGDFGKLARIAWLQAETELEKKRIMTARIQHAVAATIRARLRDRGETVRRYADLAGVSYDRMAKVLRGEALMRLEDVADAERLLGQILPALLEATETRSPEEIAAAKRTEAALRHLEALNLVREAMALEQAGTAEYDENTE